MKTLLKLSAVMALGLLGDMGTNTAQAETWAFGECDYKTDHELHDRECAWLKHDHNYTMRKDAFPAPGTEGNHQVYVCRDHGDVIGKVVNGVCYIPWGGKEYKHTSNYWVFAATGSDFAWERATKDIYNAKPPEGKELVFGTMEGRNPAYICAIEEPNGDTRVGKYVDSRCWYPQSGKEHNMHPDHIKPGYKMYFLWHYNH